MALTIQAPWYRARLSYRADQAITWTAALGGGAVAATAGAAPTGHATIDAVLVVVAVSLVSLAAGTAARQLLAALAFGAAVVAFVPALTAVGLAAGAFVYASQVRHRDEAAPGVIAAAVMLNVAVRWEVEGFFGLSSLLGVALAASIAASGLRGADPQTRRSVVAGVGLLVASIATVSVGAGVAARSADDDVADAIELSDQAADQLGSGDYVEARSLLDASAERFERANGRFDGVFGRVGLVVPVVAQHVRAGDRLTAVGADTLRRTSAAVAAADPDKLSVRNGRIDVDAVQAMKAPTDDLVASLDAARRTLDDVDSPWLLARVGDRVDDAAERFDARRTDIALAADGVAIAPSLLGTDTPRRYLVMFTTPSEARGLGGFIGNYAEITIDGGRIDVAAIGRREDLEVEIKNGGAECSGCSTQYVQAFGRFGIASGTDGSALPRAWSNLTMSPHFPDVAFAAAVLYPQSGGRHLDGVVAMDPYVLETLMEYTGPVDLPELGVTVTPEGAAAFILRDQYVLAGDDAQDERIDALDQLAENVLERLLDGALPGPVDLARDLGPHVEDRRLVAWSAHDAEQEWFARAEIDGALPPPDTRFAVTVDNASANKIEAYLERSVTVATAKLPDGSTTTVAEVTLRNGAPSSGLPGYVIGNEIGLPAGSSRLLVTFYLPARTSDLAVRRDGEPVVAERGEQAGWATQRHFVELAAGASTTYRVDLGSDADPDDSIAWVQPLVRS